MKSSHSMILDMQNYFILFFNSAITNMINYICCGLRRISTYLGFL